MSRLEAYEGIRQCIFAYALAGDRGNDPAIVERLFAEDAVYEAVGMGRFSGRVGIVHGLATLGREHPWTEIEGVAEMLGVTRSSIDPADGTDSSASSRR